MTTRLVQLALEEWSEIDGWATGHGLNLEKLPLGRFCNFVQWWATQGAEEADKQKFRAHLWIPPKGQAPDPSGPWSAEAEQRAFKALQAKVSPTVAAKG